MALLHTSGTAASMAAWFVVFEAWIQTVGWTIEAGAGTMDLTIRSVSEAGGLTMLWARVYQDVGNPTRVLVQLRDDLAGTHVTTQPGYLETDGVAFVYWITADMDAIVFVFKAGAGYRFIYAGLVLNFALTVPDETYRMVVTDTMLFAQSTILRRHDGVWDQDAGVGGHTSMAAAFYDQYDHGHVIGGEYYGTGNAIAGSLKHLSFAAHRFSANPEDKLISGWPGSDCEWTFFRERGNYAGNLFALHTAGTPPAGEADGAHFAHQTGVTVGTADFFDNILPIFLTAIGWVVDNFPAPVMPVDKRCFSAGESGTENIWVRVLHRLVPVSATFIYVMDTAGGTHVSGGPGAVTGFPCTYHISGDRDCFVYVLERAGNYFPMWGGMIVPFCQSLPSTPYKLVAAHDSAGYLLHRHDGTWNVAAWGIQADGAALNSNPNLYDGTTYSIWPKVFIDDLTAPVGWVMPVEISGRLKYMMYTSGGGIGNLDTITCGTEIYTIFFHGAAPWAMRTDVAGIPNFPGRRVYPLQPHMAPGRDSGPLQKNTQTGIPRGGVTEDYNVALRGLMQRADRLPTRPYP